MNNPVNILDALQQETPATLEVIQVTESEIALIPFTPNAESLDLHYCSEIEIRSYVPCLGAACLLCQVGRKKEPRLLLPVYLPTANAVGVLPLSRSLRPFALLPQLGPILQANKPMVAFVRREGRTKFIVSTKELALDQDAGEDVIQQFMEEYKAGRVSLKSVYPSLDNSQLAQVSEIAQMMKLKGVQPHADDSGT